MKTSRFILVVSLGMIAALTQAIVPVGQASVNDAIVRISGTGGSGTGSIIHKEYDAQTGNMFMCILTADHVTSGNNNMSVGWFDIGAVNSFNLGLGTGLSSYAVFNKNNFSNADISLLNLNINYNTLNAAQQAVLNGLTPFGLALAPNAPGYTIRSRGYGRTGVEIKNVLNETVGYRTRFGVAADAYGSLRYMDQKIDAYGNFVGGGYSFDAMYYALERSDMPGYVPDEGFGLAGDSGGGFYSGNNIVGVFTNSEGTLIRNNAGTLIAEDYYFGFRGWGPRMTAQLKSQIESHCMVPEPASLAVIGLGVAALARKRRRRNG